MTTNEPKESNMKKPEHIATATVKVAVDFDALADSFQAIADAVRAVKPAEDTKESNMSTATKYRKRPVVIEAMEFKGSPREATKIIDWALESGGTIRYHDDQGETLSVDTLEGIMTARVGDFVIRGFQGEFYPIKADIFEATYEQATS